MGFKPRQRRVTVHWVDSCSFRGWVDEEDAPERRPIQCVTTGYLLRRTDGHVEIAQNLGENDTMGEVMVIPTRNITRVERLD